MQYNKIQHTTARYIIIQYNMIQHNTKRYDTTRQPNQYTMIQYNTAQYNTVQHQHNSTDHKTPERNTAQHNTKYGNSESPLRIIFTMRYWSYVLRPTAVAPPDLLDLYHTILQPARAMPWATPHVAQPAADRGLVALQPVRRAAQTNRRRAHGQHGEEEAAYINWVIASDLIYITNKQTTEGNMNSNSIISAIRFRIFSIFFLLFSLLFFSMTVKKCTKWSGPSN